MSDDELATRLESRLMSHGVYVTEFDRTEGRYAIEYESLYADGGVIPHREVGRVINVFLDLHPDDWSGADIEAVVTDLEGEPQGSWRVERDWFAAMTAGELSETDFSAKVIGTLDG
ncbi:MAG: hypothetical protein U5J98_10465 [Halobacteriales archaeon]|nr:hypothetical protein [Halobacteriales archaeon]